MENAVRQPYYDSILLIERLHRHFLEVLKTELDRLGIQDINNVQSLILYNIGDDELTVGELTARGYYLGSNVNLVVEVADAREASRSYEANLKMFEQSRAMSASLLDLIRR